MRFTFGIITDWSDKQRVLKSVRSIIDMDPPIHETNHEILIIGGNESFESRYIKAIPFDESQKKGWITKKKNLIVQRASHPNIVLMHDYFEFDKNWYQKFVEFGNDWDVCSCQQLMLNSQRHFVDWVMWDDPTIPRYTSIDYNDWTHTKNMFQCGSFMVAKTSFLKKYPFNEDLVWGESEDVEWSLRMRDNALWKCNGKAIVRHNKKHRDCLELLTHEQ